MSEVFGGVFPVVPTPFFENGELDIESQERVLDCMIDQGVDGICILANYSEQFLLSDTERERLAEICLGYIAGRVPVIVTCSHFSSTITIQRARRAAELGADMIMLMPPYHGATLKGTEQGIFDQFKRVGEATQLPIMVQDAPLSGVELSVPFLVRLAKEIEQVSYFKIEVPGTADKLRALIAAGGSFVKGPFDGEEAITLMADLNAGATGTMSSALLPEIISTVVKLHRVGHIEDAARNYERMLPLINFENRQCGLRACKVAMKAGGVIKSDHVRHPLQQLGPESRAQLLKLAKALDLIVLKWGL